ncbi:MAG TPA: hypothetical protein VKR58_10215 [Aquella sp.]|nr:hypothetical protein [Aquella sp.]
MPFKKLNSIHDINIDMLICLNPEYESNISKDVIEDITHYQFKVTRKYPNAIRIGQIDGQPTARGSDGYHSTGFLINYLFWVDDPIETKIYKTNRLSYL